MAKREQRPTSGREWRKPREEGYVITLPSSGYSVRLRPVPLPTLVVQGKIPDTISPLAAEALWGADEDDKRDAKELLTATMELYDFVCRAAFVEPKIVDEPQGDDEISIDDVDFYDKQAVFNAALAPGAALRNFRDQQGRNVGAVHAGKDDGAEAK